MKKRMGDRRHPCLTPNPTPMDWDILHLCSTWQVYSSYIAWIRHIIFWDEKGIHRTTHFVPVYRIKCPLKVDKQHVQSSLVFCRLLNNNPKSIYLIDSDLPFSKTCLLSHRSILSTRFLFYSGLILTSPCCNLKAVLCLTRSTVRCPFFPFIFFFFFVL